MKTKNICIMFQVTQPGQVLVAVKYRRNVGSLSIDMSADNPTITLGRRIGQHIGRVSVDISTDARPICRSICRPTHLGRHIERLSTDMSVDISTDTRLICRPIHRSRVDLYVDRYIGRGVHKIHMKSFSTFTCSSLQTLPQPRDLLVTAKISSNSANPQLPSGSFRCGKNCSTCPYISHGHTSYTFSSTCETRPIKYNLTCDTKRLIYMIQCNRCNLQYIGETKRHLKNRFNEHRRTIDNPNTKYKPATAAEHFLSSNHTAKDMQLIPIEKIFSNRDSIRKAREAFLIQKGRTLDPDGLNIREEIF